MVKEVGKQNFDKKHFSATDSSAINKAKK